MIAGYDFLYFGPEKWDGLWRSRHQLLSRFAKKNRVLYVEPRYRLKETRTKWRRGEIKFQSYFKDLYQNRVTRLNSNLFIYHSPLFAPISDRFPLSRLTQHFWRMILKNTLNRLGFVKPIVWVSRPSMINLIDGFNESMVIYHVFDEYQAYFGSRSVRKDHAQNFERLLLRRADLVIVVSPKLYETKSPFNCNTHLVPNAVDYNAYRKAAKNGMQTPSDIADLPKPRIGYSGLISAKLDFKIIEKMALKHPEWSIIFLGTVDLRHCAEELNPLKKMKNVYFLNRKEISEVPYYIKAFDVCLAPYKINEHSKNISPLKLYDYMACGKPVVCTDFPAAQQLKHLNFISTSQQDFTSLVEKALYENDISLSDQRKYLASQNTWDDRVEKISLLIQSTIRDTKKSA